jgi:hypothetical protein
MPVPAANRAPMPLSSVSFVFGSLSLFLSCVPPVGILVAAIGLFAGHRSLNNGGGCLAKTGYGFSLAGGTISALVFVAPFLR